MLLCMMPLVVAGLKGYFPVLMALPFGLTAAALLTTFMGGTPAIWQGMVPLTIGIFMLSG